MLAHRLLVECATSGLRRQTAAEIPTAAKIRGRFLRSRPIPKVPRRARGFQRGWAALDRGVASLNVASQSAPEPRPVTKPRVPIYNSNSAENDIFDFA